MDFQQFDIEYAKLSDKLSSILGEFPRALDAMKKADRGDKLTDAIAYYEKLVQDEATTRKMIGKLHTEYLNYLDTIIDGANKRAKGGV
jgi:hypothetical protein